jgi:hypothetical protein
MTREEKTFSWMAVLQGLSVLAMFAIITLLGTTVIQTQDNTRDVKQVKQSVDAYKSDMDDNSRVLHKRCSELDKNKVDKREMDNLKIYMGTQFNDIKGDIKEIKQLLNSK